ncbi:dipeptide/oligopeptide/nickel ABC transporter ATP-binding protein [Dickeya dadantii]|uniref:ABC transporter ATP-binding protein n=1 Tax=Dickeya dadantii TaxID=204038 RepID=UPI001CF2AC95|nr:dipeptide/oligopeptide/nickel ABC transporter ATP-binding protein [Dickeya dadantii]MCA7013886.1 dipeptide/oligopeptide/nickel ABC transporter ATP-binding protein [Dickeya dadantii]
MLLDVRQVEKSYRENRGHFFSKRKRTVIKNVSFSLEHGDCLGIIGESGGGKSTLARLISGLEQPDRGTILLAGEPVFSPKNRRRRISAVFQDYTSSINPLMTVYQALSEPLRLQDIISRAERDRRIAELLALAGLAPEIRERYVHELSGGQIQRVCICRAVATNPQLLILDEAISALDVSSQVQILDLLIDLKKRFNLSCLFITHDIQAAAYLCNRVMFFREGEIIEACAVNDLSTVSHPYSNTLLQAVMTFR